MTYKDNTPTYNVNRKVVNFKDFLDNPNAEKEELEIMDRQNKPNTDDQQKNMANSRYKFNNTTRKMDDLSPAEIKDKIDAIEEFEELAETQGTEIKSSDVATTPVVVSRGYQKMKEVYSIYKSKGLIDDNFPEITLQQLNYRLQNFIKEVLEQFEKENMGILTDMTVYQTNLLQFQQTIFIYSNSSWFNTYMDKENPIVLKDTGEDRYIFVDSNAQYKADAENNLKGEIEKYKDILSQNGVFGLNPGTYTVGGVTTKSDIAFNINLDTCRKDITLDKIDIVKSGKPFDIVFQLQLNEWQGTQSIQMQVIDLKETSPN